MKKSWKKQIAFVLSTALLLSSVTNGQGEETASASEVGDAIDTMAVTTKEVAVPEGKDAPAAFTDLSSDELIKEMGIGWNLGNTLDAWETNDFVVGETLWGNPVTTKAMIKKIHDLGFNTIRIPVTYGKTILEDYSVVELWMSRIQEVVDYAISEDMYVVLNIHHDGCRNDAPKPHGWLDIDGTDEEFKKVREKYDGLWKTIANRFKNYDEHLLFAAMNEVFDDDHNLGWANFKHKDLKEYFETEFARINILNQDFVDIVRASGSNNAKRWVVVQPHNTQIAALMQSNYEFKIPQDITAENRIMIEVHDYDGFEPKYAFNEERKDSYANQFKFLQDNYVKKGYPVVIGEWGFPSGGPARAYCFEGVANLFRKYSLVGIVWDNGYINPKGGDQYGVFNRTTLEPSDTCIAAIMRGFYTDGELTSDYVIVGPNNKYEAVPIVPATDFSISNDAVNLKVSQSAQVTSKINSPANSNDTIVWASSDAGIASVTNGTIHANAVGTATITAKALNGTVKKTVKVTVTAGEVSKAAEKITMPENIELEKQHAYYINPVVGPEEYSDGVTYHTSDGNVATVSPDGRVLAKGPGSAVITVKTKDGLTQKMTVKVPGKVETAVPQKVTSVKAAAGKKQLTIRWKKQSGVKYKVAYSTSKAKLAKLKNGKTKAAGVKVVTVTKNSVVIKKLKGKKKYYVKVCAVSTGANGSYGNWSGIVSTKTK